MTKKIPTIIEHGNESWNTGVGSMDKRKRPPRKLTKDEEADEIVRRLTAPPTPKFPNIRLPMMRRIIPSMVANEILNVQPMTAPSSEIPIFTFRYKFNDAEDTD